MAVIDTENALRPTVRRARNIKSQPIGPVSATNVQDAIDQLSTLIPTGGVDLSPFMRLAGHQTTTGGFGITPTDLGTVSSGTVAPDAQNGNYQFLTNSGAFTLAAPIVDCAIDILITNGAGAGTVTFTGFTVGASTGDALTTTNGNRFIISLRRINAVSTYLIKALQ